MNYEFKDFSATWDIEVSKSIIGVQLYTLSTCLSKLLWVSEVGYDLSEL